MGSPRMLPGLDKGLLPGATVNQGGHLGTHSAWESILQTGCAPAYELCSAWFLIALSMPEKSIA